MSGTPADTTNGPSTVWSLEKRVGVLFVLIALFGVLVAGSAGVALRNLTAARELIITRIDPARLAGLEASAALVSQQSGVQAYALSGQRDLLRPYVDGQVQADDALRRLDRLVEDRPALVQTVAEVRRRITAWQQAWAVPAVAAAEQGVTRPEAVTSPAGQELFDAVRAGFTLLDRELTAARRAAQNRLDSAIDRFVLVLSLGVCAFLAMGGLSFLLLRRWITHPAQRLAADAQQVASGDLGHVVEPVGPAELASLGRDIEAMRRRIVDELVAIGEANRLLDEQRSELARSNAELEQFAYVASHDLQEPLRKVASFCQLIEKRYADQLDDRGRQYIDFAVDGAKRMQALINDLLAFSRVGRTTDRFRPVDLHEVATAVVASLEQVIEESGATVTVGALPTVNGDPTLLNAVFQNLIGNAIKFRSEAPPVVDVSAGREGDMWTVRVVDNGIGIPDQYAERIFVIFQRLHAREEYEGTGIGLSLCRKIIEFHGGRISIDTGRDSGTSVAFSLPAIPDDPGTAAREEAVPAPEPAPQEATLP